MKFCMYTPYVDGNPQSWTKILAQIRIFADYANHKLKLSVHGLPRERMGFTL